MTSVRTACRSTPAGATAGLDKQQRRSRFLPALHASVTRIGVSVERRGQQLPRLRRDRYWLMTARRAGAAAVKCELSWCHAWRWSLSCN